MLFFSIHPPYISWFYLNQSNFFLGIIFSIKLISSKNGQNQDEATASSCLMLATALLERRICKEGDIFKLAAFMAFLGQPRTV